MKGSPILATLFACLIMLGMYLGMRVAFSEENTLIDELEAKPKISDPAAGPQHEVHIEIYFSSQPQSFSIIFPSTGKELIAVKDISDAEWNGDIIIPVKQLTSTEIEIQCKAKWKSQEDGYHFMQLVIHPDELDPQTRTLRAVGDISDIMTFHWKEGE